MKAKLALGITVTALLLLGVCTGVGSCRDEVRRISARASALVSSVWYLRGSHTPSGQPPLRALNQDNLNQFHTAFDAGSDRARVLLLVSPTCPLCLRGVSAIQELLKRMESSDVRVLVVWEPMLASDWGKPTRPALSRIPDHRAMQFWDEDHLVAKELGQQLSASSQPSCCKREGILWDVAVLYPRHVPWGGQPLCIVGPIAEAEPELSERMQSALR